MIFLSRYPLSWAIAISLVTHSIAIRIITFDSNDHRTSEEQLIIRLQLSDEKPASAAQQAIPKPLPKFSAVMPIENNSIMRELSVLTEIIQVPRDSLIPKSKDLEALKTTRSKPLPSSEAKMQIEPPSLQQPRKKIKSLDSTHPEPSQNRSISEKMLSRVPQLPPSLPPQVSHTTSNAIQRLEPKETNAVQIDPNTPKSSNLVPSLPPPVPAKSASSDEIVTSANDRARDELISRYARNLHQTLNRRAQRKYPKKAMRDCIQGAVQIQIRISPSGEQISYEVMNPDKAPEILIRAAKRILEGKTGYSSFEPELSSEAINVQVNLVYKLPHCS